MRTLTKKGACPAFGKTCAICKEKDHFAKGCPNRHKRVNELEYVDPNNQVDSDSDDGSVHSQSASPVHGLYVCCLNSKNSQTNQVDSLSRKSWQEGISVEGQIVEFKLDTGAEINVLPLRVYDSLEVKPPMSQTKTLIQPYGVESNYIKPKGIVTLNCEIEGKSEAGIEFLVADVHAQPMLGLEACIKLNLIKRIHEIQIETDKSKFLKTNKDLFEGLGKLPGTHHIKLRSNVTPVANAPRRIPLSLLEKLKTTLDELERNGVISAVDYPTDWVNSLLIVEKSTGNLRICLDPRVLNLAIKREHHMIPTADALIAKLGGKAVFTVLDLKDGFWHIQLDEESSKLCTFNTPFGRFKFNRLPFGISSAPEVFQKACNKVFEDIEGCEVYFDDLIIAGKDEKEHNEILSKVIARARDCGVKFNKNKIQFKSSEVKYVGHIISKDGIKPDPSHIEAILKMPTPENKGDVMRLLGMSKFLGQYIPNLSEITAPLRELTKNNIAWQWTNHEQTALKNLKDKLVNAPVLAIYDSTKPIIIQTDASQKGLGACMVQTGHPISYASRSLTETEVRYAQIEKELLAIVFGVTKYHQYTYGRIVTIETDHKPLVSIFEKDIAQVSARLQRMLLKLLKYTLVVKYVPGKNLFLADTLSRAYLNIETEDDPELLYIVHALTNNLPMTSQKKELFKKETDIDPTLKKVKNLALTGWPKYKNDLPNEAKLYWNLRDKIVFDGDLLFLENKIMVPQTLQKKMLDLIHEGHLGIEKCKSRARDVMYWRGMSSDIEVTVQKCNTCQKYRKTNCKETMISYPVPDRPWQIVAADLFYYRNTDYVIVVDYYSLWIEFMQLESKTAGDVILKLKSIFARLGVPETLISDNNPFTSFEFKDFARDWDFQSTTTSPLHSQSNGLAEKSVGIVESMLKKTLDSNQDVYTALMQHRNTPLKDINLSPAQLMFSRRLRTKIPICDKLLKTEVPQVDVKTTLQEKQRKQRKLYNRNAKDLPPLEVGDKVNVQRGLEWEPAIVVEKHPSPRSYIVQNSSGSELRRNRKWLNKSVTSPPIEKSVKAKVAPATPSSSNLDNKYITKRGRIVNKPARFND